MRPGSGIHRVMIAIPKITSHSCSHASIPMTLHCPQCGSDAITLDTGGYGGMVYQCKEYGYRGSFVGEGDGGQGTGSQAAGFEKNDKSWEERKPWVPLWVKVLEVVFVLVVLWYRF